VASDRTKATIAKVTWVGRVVKSKVDKVIVSKLRSENILVTDAWRAYKTYAKEKGLQHYRIKSDDGTHVIKGIYHKRFSQPLKTMDGPIQRYGK
jgi:hypothetical protein